VDHRQLTPSAVLGIPEGRFAVGQRDLLTWFKVAESAEWANFGALKQTFRSADKVGNCVVFDVGNNRFQLIGRVFYAAGKLYILGVMDH
jgi:mRNA interferase HigB